MKTTLVLYPHQLFPLRDLPQVNTVILVEDPLIFGVDQEYRQRLHKQKLILMRAAMRRYAEEVLWASGIKVEYLELDVFMQATDLLERVRKYDRVMMFDPANEILTTRLLQARREMGERAPAIEFLVNPNFYLKEHEIRQYFAERHKHPFPEFYQWQRERFNILITEDYKPVGGDWILAAKSPAKEVTLPGLATFGNNKWVQEATEFTQKHFPENPGSTDFIWPTSHQEAAQWLQDFVNHRLDNFATYRERIDSEAPWLFHSALASSLNMGLLSPQQVVEAALLRHQRQAVPLESLEALVRQILGWREFTRGVALVGGAELRKLNPLKADRRLTNAWYSGATGLPPLDDMIKKLQARGYASHAERLFIAGTLMTVCEIAPNEIYQWFSELFIDSADWALVPHVYSLSQFADSSSLDGGPYICTSKTLMDKSTYQRGEWANVWDGLYWRFIDKHRDVLKKNPKTRALVQRHDSLDADRKRIINYRAEDFLNKFTQ